MDQIVERVEEPAFVGRDQRDRIEPFGAEGDFLLVGKHVQGFHHVVDHGGDAARSKPITRLQSIWLVCVPLIPMAVRLPNSLLSSTCRNSAPVMTGVSRFLMSCPMSPRRRATSASLAASNKRACSMACAAKADTIVR